MSKIRVEGYIERKWEDEPRARESWCKNQKRTVNGNTNLEPLAKHSSLAFGTHYGDLPFLFEGLRYDVPNAKLRDKGRPPLWCRNDRSEPNLFWRCFCACAKVRFRRLSEQEMTYLRFMPLLQLQPLSAQPSQIAHRNQFRAFSITRSAPNTLATILHTSDEWFVVFHNFNPISQAHTGVDRRRGYVSHGFGLYS